VRSSPVTCPVFMSQETPSHKQQSVPSFHDSVLGCWQFHEAELLMEKDSLNWSKERLWSRAQKWDEEIVEWKWKRNRMKERDWERDSGENPMFGWPLQDSKYIWERWGMKKDIMSSIYRQTNLRLYTDWHRMCKTLTI
jgi:hypothetical protein